MDPRWIFITPKYLTGDYNRASIHFIKIRSIFLFFFFFFMKSEPFDILPRRERMCSRRCLTAKRTSCPSGIAGYKQSMRTTRGLQIARGSQHAVPKLVLVSDSYDAFWHRRTWIVNFETGLFYPQSAVRAMSSMYSERFEYSSRSSNLDERSILILLRLLLEFRRILIKAGHKFNGF